MYCHVAGQYIMSSGGAVALNLLAVDKVFDYFEVHLSDRLELLSQVQELAAVAIQTQSNEADRLQKMAANKKR